MPRLGKRFWPSKYAHTLGMDYETEIMMDILKKNGTEPLSQWMLINQTVKLSGKKFDRPDKKQEYVRQVMDLLTRLVGENKLHRSYRSRPLKVSMKYDSAYGN